MCSFLVQIVYGACMILTVILTIAALALDGWSKVSGGEVGLFCTKEELKNMTENIGKGIMSGNSFTLESPCKMNVDKLSEMETGVKVIFACLILAILMEIVCIAYNTFTAFACCCKDILLYVLLAFTLFVVLMLGITVGVSASRNKDAFNDLQAGAQAIQKEVQKAGGPKGPSAEDLAGLGKSFIMIIIAFIASIVDVVVCGVAIFCAKKAV